MFTTDTPFTALDASGDVPEGATFKMIAELVADEIRNRFAEIVHPDYSWELRFTVDGPGMDIEIYLNHRKCLPGGALPAWDHESQALWERLGMPRYDKRNACGSSRVKTAEYRFYSVNLEEHFS
jgi:hypothetical protein